MRKQYTVYEVDTGRVMFHPYQDESGVDALLYGMPGSAIIEGHWPKRKYWIDITKSPPEPAMLSTFTPDFSSDQSGMTAHLSGLPMGTTVRIKEKGQGRAAKVATIDDSVLDVQFKHSGDFVIIMDAPGYYQMAVEVSL